MINSIKFATKSLKTNFSRSILAILGVVIGISAVIIVMSAGDGLKGFIKGQIEVFGSDTVEIEVKVPNTKHTSSENATSMVSGVSVTTFKNSDLDEIRKLDNIEAIYGGQLGQDLVSYKNIIKKLTLFSIESGFTRVDKSNLEAGRFFSRDEDFSLKQVAVLGSKAKDKLFGDEDPIGKEIKIGKLKFKVIGTIESRGSVGFFDLDDQIFIPLRTYQKKIAGTDYMQFAFAKVRDINYLDSITEELRFVMRKLHHTEDLNSDDFAVVSMTEASKMMDVVIRGIIILLISLVGISLMVGGVNIMNIMYVSVVERTFEIGLRKAVGARGQDIMRQFLWEAIIITLIGGIIGVFFGVVISFIIFYFASLRGFKYDFTIPINAIIISLSFSMLVGLIFGIYPARKASKLDPITALTKE
jgi:putative ABC transport system permease protein